MNRQFTKIPAKKAASLVLIGALFIASSFIAEEYGQALGKWLNIGPPGIIIYILIAALATIIAPVSALPLLPISVSLWGPLATAVGSIIGWFIGALAAFWIARALGRPFVERVVNTKKWPVTNVPSAQSTPFGI